jgi:hypothetical protein
MAKTIVRTPLFRLELGSDYPGIRPKLENLQLSMATIPPSVAPLGTAVRSFAN